MNSTLVIARRELTEKRFVFIAAIAFAIVTLIVPFMPGVHPGERRNALVVASLILSTGFTVGLAGILGATIIGRELSEGRLSFYFSKPVSASAIWLGKVLAATLLILVSFAVIAAPALIAGISGVVQTWTTLGDALPAVRLALGGAAVFFLFGHVIGTFVRSRSAWIAFDFIAAAVCGAGFWLLGRPLFLGFATNLIKNLAAISAVYVAVAIIAAGAWQVARGRTDRKRSHLELSRFLWMSIGSGLLIVAAFVVWVVSVPLKEVIPTYVGQAKNGSWAFLEGQVRHRDGYRATFLYNVDNGRSVRLPSIAWRGIAFSGDGKTALWMLPTIKGVSELQMAKLDVPNPHVIATGITVGRSFQAVSDDGSRAMAAERAGLLTVYDLRTKASLGSARIPEGRFWIANFVTPDLVRIYTQTAGDLRSGSFQIFEYDLRKKTLQMTGELPGGFQISPDQSRALIYWHRPSLEIRDARTGAVIVSVPPRTDAHFLTATYLRDGRIAAVEESKGVSTLRLLSADGVPIRDIPLPGNSERYFVTEAGPGLVVAVTRIQQQNSAAVIDINRGAVVRMERGLRPVNRASGPRLLCLSPEGLVAWNPATGEKHLVAGKS